MNADCSTVHARKPKMLQVNVAGFVSHFRVVLQNSSVALVFYKQIWTWLLSVANGNALLKLWLSATNPTTPAWNNQCVPEQFLTRSLQLSLLRRNSEMFQFETFCCHVRLRQQESNERIFCNANFCCAALVFVFFVFVFVANFSLCSFAFVSALDGDEFIYEQVYVATYAHIRTPPSNMHAYVCVCMCV